MKQNLDINALCTGRWHEIIPAIVQNSDFDAAIAARGRRGVPCPRCGGHDRFTLLKKFEVDGSVYCRGCGGRKHGVSTLMFLLDCSAKEVYQLLNEHFNIDNSDFVPTIRKPIEAKPLELLPDPKATARIKKLLRESLDPNHQWVKNYFMRRGFNSIKLNPQVHRFHDSVPVYKPNENNDGYVYEGRYPALLSLITNPDGKLITLHQTFITPLGQKAPVSRPKKIMSPTVKDILQYTSIQIETQKLKGDELGICEGVELAYSVMTKQSYPVWPTYSASFLSKFVPPKNVRKLHVWADLDPKGAGQVAAAKLVKKLKDKVEKIEIHFPFIDGVQPIPVPDNYQSEEIIKTLTEQGFTTCEVDNSAPHKNPDWEDILLQKVA